MVFFTVAIRYELLAVSHYLEENGDCVSEQKKIENDERDFEIHRQKKVHHRDQLLDAR